MSPLHDPPHGPRVVAVGGGHGLATTLRAVRSYASVVTAVVGTGDDGGSSGRIRRELGLPALGDLRRCLTAVAADRELAERFEHRFDSGDLAGHPLGNLILAGLVDSGLDLASAAGTVSGWLGVAPEVISVLPVTSEVVELVARTPTGECRGQVHIERDGEVISIATVPADPAVTPAVLDAVGEADQIVLAPGSFFTSVVATAAIPALRDAIADSDAHLVFVCNLAADEPSVKGFDVARHVEVLERHGLRPRTVLVQADAMPVGLVEGVEVVVGDVDRPHRLAHDSDLLGAALRRLA